MGEENAVVESFLEFVRQRRPKLKIGPADGDVTPSEQDLKSAVTPLGIEVNWIIVPPSLPVFRIETVKIRPAALTAWLVRGTAWRPLA